MNFFPEIRAHRLANGLLVLAAEIHSLPILSHQVHFAAGSRYERPGITGISHLFEHLMFKGTRRVKPEEFARIIQAHGGTLNAFTTTDNTSYYENLPAEKLELAMDLEADRLANLQLTSETLEPEREVVRSERKLRSVNSPFGLLIEQLSALAYEQHPYRWPVIGWDADLKTLTLEDCREYYRTHYAPNNAVVVVVGDVAAEEVFRLAENITAPSRPSPPRTRRSPRRSPSGAKSGPFIKRSPRSPLFLRLFISPGSPTPTSFPCRSFARFSLPAGPPFSSEKFEKPGKAVEAQAEMGSPPFFFMDPGLLQIYAIASPVSPWKSWRGRSGTKWKRCAGTANGRNPAQSQETSPFGFSPKPADPFLQRAAGRALPGSRRRLPAALPVLSRYESVTAEEVLQAARKYLRPENRTVVSLQPVSQAEHDELGEIE